MRRKRVTQRMRVHLGAETAQQRAEVDLSGGQSKARVRRTGPLLHLMRPA